MPPRQAAVALDQSLHLADRHGADRVQDPAQPVPPGKVAVNRAIPSSMSSGDRAGKVPRSSRSPDVMPLPAVGDDAIPNVVTVPEVRAYDCGTDPDRALPRGERAHGCAAPRWAPDVRCRRCQDRSSHASSPGFGSGGSTIDPHGKARASAQRRGWLRAVHRGLSKTPSEETHVRGHTWRQVALLAELADARCDAPGSSQWYWCRATTILHRPTAIDIRLPRSCDRLRARSPRSWSCPSGWQLADDIGRAFVGRCPGGWSRTAARWDSEPAGHDERGGGDRTARRRPASGNRRAVGAVTVVVFGRAAQRLAHVIAGVVLRDARTFRVGERVRLHGGSLAGSVEGIVNSLGSMYTTLVQGVDPSGGPTRRRNVAVVRCATRCG